MPNIWTHILFCEEVADAVKKPYPFSKYENYMKLGAQGPDPFFYHNFWPWIKEGPVQEIGNLLHTEKCGDFLVDLITSAKNKSEHIKAYVYGFITHHILDRNTHPYIHYRAGYDGNKHQKLEVIIDTLLMEKYHNLKTWKSPVYKEIDVGLSLDRELCDFLDEAIRRNYSQIKQESHRYIQKSYRDMKLALRLLSDPYGWKNVLFSNLISSFSHQPIQNKKDYLNMKNKTWNHPATNERFTDSFMDLYSQAKAEGFEILSEVQRYWNNKDTSSKYLHELIGDISYDTGKPLSLQLENRYAEPIV
ncbi:zinc dependent phospholipase C family protein [Virgibacillus sp. SK37]|uniref:zinc dependent phospholipase C family protein n=1 Tax=Virgibacillus sp. SK37 TaxID=403957 RepID=UPI0004D12409|nr:zinc dependent phospholipase C family protein [Virgibacillus sp. SK37]AIF42684.1 hypothetical protein X953_05035 [Virgibacillus sp. SK37]